MEAVLAYWRGSIADSQQLYASFYKQARITCTYIHNALCALTAVGIVLIMLMDHRDAFTNFTLSSFFVIAFYTSQRFRKKFRLVQSRADDIAKSLIALLLFGEVRVNFCAQREFKI